MTCGCTCLTSGHKMEHFLKSWKGALRLIETSVLDTREPDFMYTKPVGQFNRCVVLIFRCISYKIKTATHSAEPVSKYTNMYWGIRTRRVSFRSVVPFLINKNRSIMPRYPILGTQFFHLSWQLIYIVLILENDAFRSTLFFLKTQI